MALSNIRISKSGNIVADHRYNEDQPGVSGRTVKTVKVLAKPIGGGKFEKVSTSKEATLLLQKFSKKTGFIVQWKEDYPKIHFVPESRNARFFMNVANTNCGLSRDQIIEHSSDPEYVTCKGCLKSIKN